jgi:hypothetical protein
METANVAVLHAKEATRVGSTGLEKGNPIMGRRGIKRHSKVVWPGFSNVPAPRHVAKIGRNDLCPCESGKKYKDCHQKEGSAFLEKLARQEDKVKIRAARQRLKDQGVPWFKRIFVRIQ